jgi:hypothetical protein
MNMQDIMPLQTLSSLQDENVSVVNDINSSIILTSRFEHISLYPAAGINY